MQLRRRNLFATVRAEGSILPADLLQRINDRDADLGGLSAEDYHLAGNLKLNEAINQSWNRLLGAWSAFRAALAQAPQSDPATTLTREKWLLPLFHELGYGRLLTAKAVEIDGKSYAVSHGWQNTPIHLIGARVELDKRTAGVAGAARMSPHGMLQELLNRSDGHLWGFVSNGLRLRILRDNVSLTRQAYVEFDLEAMMDGEVYPDFALCWLLCHESRVNAEKPQDCLLEKWSKAAHDQGTRALEQLRTGVENAIKALGRGFLDHSNNRALVERLRSGALDKQDYYRQLLRLVYRMLFLFVAEDRELLLKPDAGTKTREGYDRFYSISRLRRLAERRAGGRHGDLYHGLRVVMEKLGGDAGCAELGLPALGGFLFSRDAVPDLNDCEISNVHLLEAVRKLAFINDRHGRRLVDYRNLRSEELGSVYEALLELHPVINAEAKQFDLPPPVGGNERKKTGSYYTPESLVQCLLDSALDPVLAEAARKPDAEQAILRLKVVDPACGSGHFLIAAAHRMAKRLATVRTGDDEPAPEAVRTALRDVIGRCIYGVDINPMAVELCKVSLWMEALEPGKPLSFLENRIQCGNALIGATPALLKKGIPDDAFKPIEGDDKTTCAEYRRYNKQFREIGQRNIFESEIKLGTLAQSVLSLEEIDDSTIEGVREKQRRWEELVRSSDYLYGGLLADAWCAAFVWKKLEDRDHPRPITEEMFRKIEERPWHVARTHHEIEIKRLAAQYQFFHWHLAFPDVFRAPVNEEEPENKQAGWSGGFNVVLGNPPWERIKLQEKEWFAQRNPDIANAPNAAARQRMIRELRETDPALYEAFLDDRRKSEGESHLARNSGRFPLCGTGDINTYAIFAETNRMLINATGRVGCIVPSGIATDDTTKLFFQSLASSQSLANLYDFENRDGIFPGVHRSYKFCLLTMTGTGSVVRQGTEFIFFAHKVEDLLDDGRRFKLSAEEIALLNPNTRTCPVFRSQRDTELTKAIYRRIPVLIREGKAKGAADDNTWGIKFMTMFHMANDSGLFRARADLLKEGWRLSGTIFGKDGESYLPLYEAKMLHHFTHRYGDYGDKLEDSQNISLPDVPIERLQNPRYVVQPRYWVSSWEVVQRISQIPPELLKAYLQFDEAKIRSVITWWFAGYCFLTGNDEGGARLLRAATGTPATGNEAIQQWLAARSLAIQYPLKFPQLDLFNTRDDFIEFARELIELHCPKWLLGWRDICRNTDERTVIASVLPPMGVGHKFPLMMFTQVSAAEIACFNANLNSFVFDYTARQKMGSTSLTYFYLKQFPVLPPSTYDQICAWSPSLNFREWLAPRTLELVYTAYDLRGFAEDCGYTGEPFRWDKERRFLLRCELDAAYFHLYGIGREDVDYILDTFPIVRRKDEQAHGEYRTKRVILEIYDEMGRAMESGAAYQTRLDPPPANGWAPPELAREEMVTKSAPPAEIADEKQSDLFAWQAEDPQQQLKFDDID